MDISENTEQKNQESRQEEKVEPKLDKKSSDRDQKEVEQKKNTRKEEKRKREKEDRSNSPDENHFLTKYSRMKVKKGKKKTREDYADIVMTLKDRLSAAIKADRERVMQGKFGGEKLKLMPKLVEKLGNRLLCLKFLDMQGLDLLGEMIYKFPNGEYPSANTRNRVLKIVRNMPVEREHIIKTKFGGFLTFIEKKKDEILENKKLANEIKQKWTRVVLNENIDYTMLQDEQHELTQAYLRKRSAIDGFASTREKKRRKGVEEPKDALEPRKNFRRTSYNFLIMPKNDKMTKKYKKMKEKERLEKQKKQKRDNSAKKGTTSASKQGMDLGDDSPN